MPQETKRHEQTKRKKGTTRISTPETELLKSAVKKYPGVQLHHRFGNGEFDEDSESRDVWKANLVEKKTHLIYGPYDDLENAGRYMACFKLKVNDNSTARTILYCDVLNKTSGRTLAKGVLAGDDFRPVNEYCIFGIEFEYREHEIGNRLEYRLENSSIQERTIWVDYVIVVPI